MITGILLSGLLIQQPSPPQNPIPPPPQLSIEDFKSKLGECSLNEIQMTKQNAYIQTLTAKIRELQAEVDRLKTPPPSSTKP